MCVTAEPVLTASLSPVAAAVQIEWSPVVIALTEGGLLYSAAVCGAGRRAALYSQSSKYRTGSLFSIFSFFFVGGGQMEGISIQGFVVHL